MGDDIFIGSCDTDIAKIRFETRSELSWHRLSDRTRARRANVGEIKFSIAWGPNEQEEEEDDLEMDEEDQELTSHVRKEKSSFLGRMTGVFCAFVCNFHVHVCLHNRQVRIRTGYAFVCV